MNKREKTTLKHTTMEKNMNNQNEQQGLEERASHTRDERNAYRAMPELMKMRVKRNPMIWYGTIKNYFPDLLFEDCKVVIEIDGRSHNKRVEYDTERDERFEEMGYVVLRFKNEETRKRKEFLQKLLNKFEQIEKKQGRYGLSTYIRSMKFHLNSLPN